MATWQINLEFQLPSVNEEEAQEFTYDILDYADRAGATFGFAIHHEVSAEEEQ